MKGLFLFLLVLLIIVVGAGLYLKWFNVSTKSDDQAGTSSLQVTIDKNRVSEDVQGGLRTARDLVTGKNIEGEVLTADTVKQNLTVRVKDAKEEMLLRTDANTHVRLISGQGTVQDLAPGMMVHVNYEVRDGENFARTITVRK